MKKALIALHFSRAASTYADASQVQRELGRALMELLPAELKPQQVLELGCGDGERTAELAARYPGAAFHAVDLAPAMLEKAKRALAGHRATFLQADMDDPGWWPHEAYDLAYSNLALQWSEDGAAVLRRVRESLRPGGYLALAQFLEGTCRELSDAFTTCGVRLKARPGFIRSAELSSRLATAGLTQVFAGENRTLELFPDLVSVLRHIRELGAVSGMEGVLTPRLLRRIESCWKGRHPHAEGLPLSWQYALVVARKLLP